MADQTAAITFAQKNGARFVEELKALLRIPSVSTAPEHVGDVRRAAEFVADGLRAAGMEVVEGEQFFLETRGGETGAELREAA